jgi:hypothetical protein
MKLLTQELLQKFPKLKETEMEENPEIIAKFFAPWTNWTWYATEFDGEDLFFGLVDGFEKELGYFRLSELKAIKGPFGLRIERDLHFEDKRLNDVK